MEGEPCSSGNRTALVYGGGCIGALAVYLLSASIPASNIAVICRSNLDAVKKRGITIHSTIWGSSLTVHPEAFGTIDEAVRSQKVTYDYVFVTTKAMSNANTDTAAITTAVSPGTTVVLMQNGIDIEEPWSRDYPVNTILSAVLYMPVKQTEPAIFAHHLHTDVRLGTYPAHTSSTHANQACKEVIDVLRMGGAEVTFEDNIQVARWKKIIVNGSENPICALTNLPDATFFRSSSGSIQFTRQVMQEIALIARAAGCNAISDDVVQKQLDFLTSRPLPGVEPSMLADVKERRPMEVDAILGNLLLLAERHQVDTPRLETLYYLAVGLNRSIGH